jgi:hypothetical protein
MYPETLMSKHRLVMLLMLCASTAHATDRDDDDIHGLLRLPTVFDARGRAIGPYMTFAGQDGVLTSIGDKFTVIPLRRKGRAPNFSAPYSASQFQYNDTYFPSGGFSLRFTSPNCSGDPVIFGQSGPWPVMVTRRGNTVTVYVAGTGPIVQAPIRSGLVTPANTCAAITDPTPVMVVPVGAVYDVSRQHPEPLSIGW